LVLRNLIFALSLCAATGSAAQTSLEDMSEEDLNRLLDSLEQQLIPQKTPSMTGVATASTAPHGIGFIGVAGTNNRESPDEDKIDGSFALGVGFGDPVQSVGAQVIVDITSTKLNGFADSGLLGVKISRIVQPAGQPVALGIAVDQWASWGDSGFLDPAVTLVGTTQFSGPVLLSERWPLLLTAGVRHPIDARDGDTEPFAGIGVGLAPWLGASLAHDGGEWIIGATGSLNAFPGVGFGAAMADPTNEIGDRRAIITVSYAARLFGD
jgi:hypothetical protein